MPWSVTTTGLVQTQQRWTYASQALGTVVGKLLQTRLTEAVQYARATYLTGGTTGTRLASRTGALAASFDAEVQVTGQRGGVLVTARLGYIANAPSWAGVHEYGATIHAKNTMYLAIPLNAEARSMAPRQMSNTFVARSRAGNLIVFKKLDGGGIEPEYLLKTEVFIPARPALAPTLSKFSPLIAEDFKGAVRSLFQRGA